MIFCVGHAVNRNELAFEHCGCVGVYVSKLCARGLAETTDF